MLIVGVIAFFLMVMLYALNFFLSIKKMDMLKVNVFESGFLSVGVIQNSFSIHFFIMMLMFVVFDLEIVMFLGLLMSDFLAFNGFILLLLFIFGGFYMEWWYGKLIWVV
uniref:NADH-ubiquinone oxidoreductase chain 3 n=1 Tax=Nematodirus spathiger TaxID=61841 RepID=A0A075CFZ9_NEMSP|nr:NADH dehydrogenase subunit 3 [Nematodirus spathiger]AGZ64201.1 NADH dehydrogenase subunit 3 [Nematodirus spathiger]